MFVDVESCFSEIEAYMPHFLFYRKGKKSADIYCTACHERYELTDKKLISSFKHKKQDKCPCCHGDVQYRQMDRGRKGYRYYDNFAVFGNCGDALRISCITVYQGFEEDIMEPVYDYRQALQYELTKGRAVEYRKSYNCITNEWDWRPMKRKPSEPIFIGGAFGMGYNGYHVIGYEAISNSFLGYLFKGADETELPHLFVTYYCRCAEHLQLEYLVHGGLRALADQYVAGYINCTRLNWKSNDLKKILRLNKPELELMKDSNGQYYTQYVFFRRECCKGFNTADTLKYYNEFGHLAEQITYISYKTGVSPKRVMDYVLKHRNAEKNTFMIHLWKDYLRECELLEYDLHDETVSMPKNIAAAHERTAMIIKAENDAVIQRQIEVSNAAREKMRYTDTKRGLVVIVPESVEEIAREGRILSHCVGGYAKRHAEGALSILFVRQIGKENIPYYTMEVNLSGQIVQCRGFKNNMEHNGGSPKPQEIIDFEKDYQEYLNNVFKQPIHNNKKSRKTA